ncbi:MAG: DNA cytosine methyltransferase, partial [Proteobacteria bacterium]|nr:DNA cytosine methyltransferase [Pseudomonadota bacterium]
SNHLRVGFEEVANDLQRLGYKIKAGLFTAQEVGAPHKRERLFILAYRDSFRSPVQRDRNAAALEGKSTGEKTGGNQFAKAAKDCSSRNMANRGFGGCLDGSDNISKRHLQTNQFGQSSQNQQERQRRVIGPCKNSENDGLATKLANGSNIFCKWCERQRSGSGKSETKAGSDDNKLGNANNERLEGHCQCQCCDQLPTWPPSPASHEQWDGIANHLKPALHRMADGLADRVDAVRACGNGVVPLVAAYAWRTLTNGMYLTKNN